MIIPPAGYKNTEGICLMATRKKKAPQSAVKKTPEQQKSSVPLRIASFSRVISPETVGTRLAGYGTKIFSES